MSGETRDNARDDATTLVNTGGGAYVDESVYTEGGDFIGRDKNINIHIHTVSANHPKYVGYSSIPKLPEKLVPRPNEYNLLKKSILDPNFVTVENTPALLGAGGFGKTTLAQMLCADKEVQQYFSGGILWIELGETPDLLGKLNDLIEYLVGQRPTLVDIALAVTVLKETLANRRCLLVIDDVRQPSHVKPFLLLDTNITRLLITRNRDALPEKTIPISVDAMQQNESLELLSYDLPAWQSEERTLVALVKRLGQWPLLLNLVNRVLLDKVRNGFDLGNALKDINERFDAFGLTAYDQRDGQDRTKAVRATIEVSINQLSTRWNYGRQEIVDEKARFYELAVFPEAIDIPFVALQHVWPKKVIAALCERLFQLSLLLLYNETQQTIRLHDVIRHYLIDSQWNERTHLHERFLKNYCHNNQWTNGPDDGYFYQNIAYHLFQANYLDQLRELLLNFDWLQKKLENAGIVSLINDFSLLPEDSDLILLRDTLQMIVPVLSQDKTQLASQLMGRLMNKNSQPIIMLLEQVQQVKNISWLRPLTPSLTSPGGPLVRTFSSHTGRVYCLAVSSDGKRFFSGAQDSKIKIWDVESGVELYTLEGHTGPIKDLSISQDQKYLISASRDNTLRVWDIGLRQTIQTLEGHTGWVNAVTISEDGKKAVSASSDGTLRIWDFFHGSELHTLYGHTSEVADVIYIPNSTRVISASYDKTLKVWDIDRGTELYTLSGHTSGINTVTVTSDGKKAISGSHDKTLKLWELGLKGGVGIHTFQGTQGDVAAVTIFPDEKRIASSSWDYSITIWDMESGLALSRMHSGHHEGVVALATIPGKQSFISASYDGTMKLWDMSREVSPPVLSGHTGAWVKAIAFAADGSYGVSASWDHSLIIWDLETKAKIRTMFGHKGPIKAIVITEDGKRIISASSDNTVKIWNMEDGTEIRTLQGHTQTVNDVLVISNGEEYVISVSSDSTLKVWRMESGEMIAQFFGEDSLLACRVAPDDSTIVAQGSSGQLYFLRLEGIQ